MRNVVGFGCSVVAYLPIAWWLQPPYSAGVALAFLISVVVDVWLRMWWNK